jgi:hypothetical protein
MDGSKKEKKKKQNPFDPCFGRLLQNKKTTLVTKGRENINLCGAKCLDFLLGCIGRKRYAECFAQDRHLISQVHKLDMNGCIYIMHIVCVLCIATKYICMHTSIAPHVGLIKLLQRWIGEGFDPNVCRRDWFPIHTRHRSSSLRFLLGTSFPIDLHVLSLSLVLLNDASRTPMGLCGTEFGQLSAALSGMRKSSTIAL